jgi:branched-chain amino acid transport system ATP-binding protein
VSLLDVADLTARYAATPALHGVSLDVAEGEAVALMGRNGMGKTTTIRSVMRMIPSAGRLTFAGVDLHPLPSHRAARLGLGLVPEGRRCFGPLTVWENLMAAARPGPWGWEEVAALFPRLAERRGQVAATLSGGEQQMLTIARALMTNPRLLLLDEATEGLAPIVRQEIWAAIGRLKHAGLALLIVDASVAELRGVADRAVVLERGRDVWCGPMDALTPEVAARHLGV